MPSGKHRHEQERPTLPYRLLADLVLLFHLGFILFVVLGGLLALRWRQVAWLHVPAALWGVYIQFTGAICPLTPLENGLRRMGGQAGYSGGFVEHYLLSIIYPAGLTRDVQMVLGVVVLSVTAAIYLRLMLHSGGLHLIRRLPLSGKDRPAVADTRAPGP
jgi:hypothetical protein